MTRVTSSTVATKPARTRSPKPPVVAAETAQADVVTPVPVSVVTPTIQSAPSATVATSPVPLRSQVAEMFVADYPKADRAGKARIRKQIDELFDAAFLAMDIEAMKLWRDLGKSIVGKSGSGASSEPIDPRQPLWVRIEALRMAADMLASGDVTPATSADEEPIDITKLDMASFVATDELKIQCRELAEKLASQRVTGTGNRSSLTDHIAEAVRVLSDGDETKLVTVSQINAFRGESLPEGPRSIGAIAARLFPRSGNGCTVPNIAPIDSTATTPKGARYVADWSAPVSDAPTIAPRSIEERDAMRSTMADVIADLGI